MCRVEQQDKPELGEDAAESNPRQVMLQEPRQCDPHDSRPNRHKERVKKSVGKEGPRSSNPDRRPEIAEKYQSQQGMFKERKRRAFRENDNHEQCFKYEWTQKNYGHSVINHDAGDKERYRYRSEPFCWLKPVLAQLFILKYNQPCDEHENSCYCRKERRGKRSCQCRKRRPLSCAVHLRREKPEHQRERIEVYEEIQDDNGYCLWTESENTLEFLDKAAPACFQSVVVRLSLFSKTVQAEAFQLHEFPEMLLIKFTRDNTIPRQNSIKLRGISFFYCIAQKMQRFIVIKGSLIPYFLIGESSWFLRIKAVASLGFTVQFGTEETRKFFGVAVKL